MNATHESTVTTLFHLTKAIATIRNQHELVQFIMEHLKPLFGFYDCGLFVFSHDKTTLEDWTVSFPQISPSEANIRLAGQNAAVFGVAGSPWEVVLERLRQADSPVVHRYNESLPGWSGYVQASVLDELDYRETLLIRLLVRGEELGVFCINSLETGFFSRSNQIDLFGHLTDLIAVAVANILANEQIAERAREKEALISTSQTIASIRERKELLATIIDKLKPLIPVDDTGLLVLDSTGARWQDWTIVDNYQEHAASTQLQRLGYKEWQPMDRLMEYTLCHSGIMSLARFREQYPEHPFGPVMWEAGLREMMFAPLVYQGRKLGVLYFDSEQEGTYTQEHLVLFKAVADLIAVAVANILANEEILEREQEKSVLLSISEDIATVRHPVDLLKVINGKIKQLIPFYDTGVLIVDPSGQYHYDIAVTMADWDASEGNQRLQAEGHGHIAHPGSFVERIMQKLEVQNGPLIENWEVLFRSQEYPFFKVMREVGYKETMVTNLKSGGEIVGTLWINALQHNFFNPTQFSLFQSIADQVAVAVANILANKEILELNEQLQEQNAYLLEEVGQQYNFGEMVGQSPVLQNLYHNLRLVASTDTTVLIIGESGTGKELVARALHQASPRRAKPLIKVNCAALPTNLIESELFGHERGAFTGATDRRIGKFELAHGSTLFLDEIGELPLDLQAKLLRAIQEKEIERLGGNKVIQTDVRIVSATNRNLAAEVAAGRFRADLYYRLSVFPITLPPLRERPGDLPLLVTHILQKLARRLGKPLQGISKRAMRQVQAYDWPGNIRELENVLERAAILSPGSVIQELYLSAIKPGSSSMGKTATAPIEETALKTAADNEREHILRVLRHCKGKVSGRGGAAEILGLKATTLEFRMKKLGIRREHVRGDFASGVID